MKGARHLTVDAIAGAWARGDIRPSGYTSVMGVGVRRLRLRDQLPDCEVGVNQPAYRLESLVSGKRVVDVGCGFGPLRPVVEAAGGTWVGVEPFEGGAHMVKGSAEALPFADASFDVAIMDAVLEHVPDASKAFGEVARVLRPGGLLVGYVAFMECYHEISYSHLSFKALENFARQSGMRLVRVCGGSRFGIDYHLGVLLYPLPLQWVRPIVAAGIRGVMRAKSAAAYCGLRLGRRMSHHEALELASLHFKLEALRQSNGFTFVIERLPD